MKKFIISSEALKKALTPLGSAISKTTVLPILECVHLMVDGFAKSLTITATNLETHVVACGIDIEGTETFSTCIDYKRLMSIVSNCDTQPLSFKVGAVEADIIGDEFTISISCCSGDEFPKLPSLSHSSVSVVEVKEFYDVARKAIPFTSSDDLRPAMTGVYMHKFEDGLRIVSTDAHKLFYKKIKAVCESEEGFIVPAAGLNLILLLCKNIKEEKKISLVVSPSLLMVRVDDYTVYTKLIDAKYPDYAKAIVDADKTFYLDRKKMKAFLKMADAFVPASTNLLQLTACPKTEKLSASSNDVDFGTGFHYRLNAYNFNNTDEFRIGINARYLLKCIGFHTDEYVEIRHTGVAMRAIIIDNQILLMPLMRNDGNN